MTVIEVFADIWCPFAHVGLHRTVERRARVTGDDFELEIRAWPLELVNGASLDPATTAHHVSELRSLVAPDLFLHFDPGHFPTTSLPALASAHAAYDHDRKTGESVSLALRDALFEQGLDISRPEVIAGVAADWGVPPYGAADEQSVLDDWHEGVARGVRGSPHFFCGDTEAFCPSLDIAKDGDGRLEIHVDLDALDTFLAGCSAG
jgi:predicted DsbA family dithiol-disulfide isomerase